MKVIGAILAAIAIIAIAAAYIVGQSNEHAAENGTAPSNFQPADGGLGSR